MTSTKLDMVRAKAAAARDLKREIEDLEQRLKDKKAELLQLCRHELPDLMAEIGLDSLGLKANGNMPAVDVILEPYYWANIPAAWDPQRRQRAFDWLAQHGAGDLIKTKIEVAFLRQDFEKANQTYQELVEQNLDPSFGQTVHNKTLTAWLREQVEAGEIPDLDTIGGEVGRVVILRDKT